MNTHNQIQDSTKNHYAALERGKINFILKNI